VEYHILLSPTYQVPVLYFQLLHFGTPAPLSEVYRVLVEDGSDARTQLQRIGVQGAISQGDHPVFGVPYFFLHPCGTLAAMAEWEREECVIARPEEYLKVWLGVVGAVVGLYLPVNSMVVEESGR
jgi:ubiquitin-like-conjugating enzyme ATG10